jgi:branched-chain amino acid transport system ATP-binding protein
MFEVTGLRASYGPAEVVRGVSLTVPPGRAVAVVGPNGAGKSTLANALCGVHTGRTGSVRLDGREIGSLSTVDIARAGVRLVPQGRRVFGSVTVAEHLSLARPRGSDAALSRDDLLDLFPPLRTRLAVRARSLSGGEQQMLAITRAVLPGPRILVLDEPTEGLAPAVVTLVARLIGRLCERGVGVLLMEQGRGFPYEVADEVFGLDRGELTAGGVPTAAAREGADG